MPESRTQWPWQVLKLRLLRSEPHLWGCCISNKCLQSNDSHVHVFWSCFRMSNEVKKSHIQRSELHKELGADMFASWTQDHAQQVLSSQRYELWRKEGEKAKKALQQLESTSICDNESSDDASHWQYNTTCTWHLKFNYSLKFVHCF